MQNKEKGKGPVQAIKV